MSLELETDWHSIGQSDHFLGLSKQVLDQFVVSVSWGLIQLKLRKICQNRNFQQPLKKDVQLTVFLSFLLTVLGQKRTPDLLF